MSVSCSFPVKNNTTPQLTRQKLLQSSLKLSSNSTKTTSNRRGQCDTTKTRKLQAPLLPALNCSHSQTNTSSKSTTISSLKPAAIAKITISKSQTSYHTTPISNFPPLSEIDSDEPEAALGVRTFILTLPSPPRSFGSANGLFQSTVRLQHGFNIERPGDRREVTSEEGGRKQVELVLLPAPSARVSGSARGTGVSAVSKGSRLSVAKGRGSLRSTSTLPSLFEPPVASTSNISNSHSLSHHHPHPLTRASSSAITCQSIPNLIKPSSSFCSQSRLQTVALAHESESDSDDPLLLTGPELEEARRKYKQIKEVRSRALIVSNTKVLRAIKGVTKARKSWLQGEVNGGDVEIEQESSSKGDENQDTDDQVFHPLS